MIPCCLERRPPKFNTLVRRETDMAIIKINFDGYKIWYHSRYPYGIEAYIEVYKGKINAGRMFVFKDVPYDLTLAERSIAYPLSRFNDVITILREEKALYLMLDPDSKWGCLATTDIEPTGEEDAK
jgi:hypothetical protein